MKLSHLHPVVAALVAVTLLSIQCDTPSSPREGTDFAINTDFYAEDSLSYELDATVVTALDVRAINGAIVLVGRDGSNSVTISAVKRVESESTKDAEAHLEQLEVDVQVRGNEILVGTIQPSLSAGRHYLVNYTIILPKGMEVKINSVNGTISLNEIASSSYVDLVNGTIKGTMTLPLDGTFDMTVINGEMDLEIPKSTSAELSAGVVNGTIGVFGLELQKTTETSKSLTGRCGDGRGTIELNMTNGNIRVNAF